MKKIYQFHYDIVNKKINELNKNQKVIFESYFLLKIFKEIYKKNNIKIIKIKSNTKKALNQE